MIGIRGIYLDYCDECNVILNNSCFDTSKQSLISHNGSLEVYGGSYRSENMFSMELYKSSISIYDGKFEGYYGGLFLDELTLISIESGEFFSKGDFGAITSLKEPNIFLLNNSVINDDSYNIYSCSLFDFEQNVLLDKIYSFNKFVEVKRYNEDFIDDDKLDDNYDYDNKEENNVDVENQEDCNIDKENLEDNTTFEIIENPKTGDNIFMLLITLFCSLILIIIIILIDICILF